ncbi:MAG: ribosome maturation factor RimM [Dehalococcoidia bacterium]
MKKQNLIVVGKINGPWGIKGFVKFTPSVNEPGLYEKNNIFYLDNQQTELTEIMIQNKKKYLRFESIENRNDAESLAGKTLAVNSHDFKNINLIEKKETRIGMQVISNNSILGMIEQVIQTGANDVFVVRTPSGELLVPDIADFIVSVDEENNLMTIKNEDGL